MISLLLASLLTLMEFNVENLFDCQHDSLKNDTEFLPDGSYHWTRTRYWNKLQKIGKEILAAAEWENDGNGEDYLLPDLVALCEVENDTCLRDLTRRSLLRNAGYEYVMTSSPDLRGIDVALLYSPLSFRLYNNISFRIKPLEGMKPTRDILYAGGILPSGDTLHVYVVHAPSRSGWREGNATTPHARGQTTLRGHRLVESFIARSLNPRCRRLQRLQQQCVNQIPDRSRSYRSLGKSYWTQWGKRHLLLSRPMGQSRPHFRSRTHTQRIQSELYLRCALAIGKRRKI